MALCSRVHFLECGRTLQEEPATADTVGGGFLWKRYCADCANSARYFCAADSVCLCVLCLGGGRLLKTVLCVHDSDGLVVVKVHRLH